MIVDDEEAMAEYYHLVYGLNKLRRVGGDADGAAEALPQTLTGALARMSSCLTEYHQLEKDRPETSSN